MFPPPFFFPEATQLVRRHFLLRRAEGGGVTYRARLEGMIQHALGPAKETLAFQLSNRLLETVHNRGMQWDY